MESIKALNRWLNGNRVYFAKKDLVNFGPQIEIRPFYSDHYRKFNSDGEAEAFASNAICWGMDGVSSEGVKIFMPTEEEYFALASIELRIPFSELRQPFDTFFVVIPDAVAKQCRIDFALSRFEYDKQLGVMVVVGDDWASMSYYGGANTDLTLEDRIDPRSFADGSGMGQVFRVIVNASLLLTQSGCKSFGRLNPDHAAKLEASLKKKNLPDSVRRANADALRLIPQVYGFDQYVKLFDREDDPHDPTGTGTPVKPHWRRGHWAQQAHGTGHAQRKLIFRRPVLVNSHRFGGDLADTRVTITT